MLNHERVETPKTELIPYWDGCLYPQIFIFMAWAKFGLTIAYGQEWPRSRICRPQCGPCDDVVWVCLKISEHTDICTNSIVPWPLSWGKMMFLITLRISYKSIQPQPTPYTTHNEGEWGHGILVTAIPARPGASWEAEVPTVWFWPSGSLSSWLSLVFLPTKGPSRIMEQSLASGLATLLVPTGSNYNIMYIYIFNYW